MSDYDHAGLPFLIERWREKAGLPPSADRSAVSDSPEELRASEWSPRFEELMRARLVIGAMRFGKIGAKGKPKYDRLASIEKRIKLYRETGNDELLVDIANMALLEFEEGTHPKKHFKAIDDELRVGCGVQK